MTEVSHELKESKNKKQRRFKEDELTDLEDQQSEADDYEAAD